MHPKTDEKKEKKGKAAKEEKPKQEKKEKPKKEQDNDDDDDGLPKAPKAKDPYAGLPKRLEIHAIHIYVPVVVYCKVQNNF